MDRFDNLEGVSGWGDCSVNWHFIHNDGRLGGHARIGRHPDGAVDLDACSTFPHGVDGRDVDSDLDAPG